MGNGDDDQISRKGDDTRFYALALLAASAIASIGGRFVESSQEKKARAVKLKAFAYECEDRTEFVTHFHPNANEITVFLLDRTVRLPLVKAASGTQYTDGTISFWSKGDGTLLVKSDGTSTKCREIRRKSIIEDAKLRGVEFYGRGNEPGWKLEVSPDEIVFVTNYGQDSYRSPPTQPEIDQENRRTVYRMQSEGHELTVEIRGVACADDMSGEAFESTVVITLDGRTHRGCGHSLR